MLLLVLIALLHLLAVALLLSHWVPMPPILVGFGYLVGPILQLIAFAVTGVAMALSRTVRRDRRVWVVNGIGAIALWYWRAVWGPGNWETLACVILRCVPPVALGSIPVLSFALACPTIIGTELRR